MVKAEATEPKLTIIRYNPKVWKPNFEDRGAKCLRCQGLGASEAFETQISQSRSKKGNWISVAKVDISIKF